MRGSTTNIVDPSGNSVKQYTYDEFGNVSATGTFDNEITFTGSVSDSSTGLQYMNSRYYSASTGRFLSQDSYSGNAYEPRTQHLYSYCGNNPTNFIDPTGHRPESADLYALANVQYQLYVVNNKLSKAYLELRDIFDDMEMFTMGTKMHMLGYQHKNLAKKYYGLYKKTKDKADALKAQEKKDKEAIETAIVDLVNDTHLKDNYVGISLDEGNEKVIVDFKGPMDMIGVNIGEGSLHLCSRENNDRISREDLRYNYLYSKVDVMLCMDIYKVLCKYNNKQYDLEDRITVDDFVNEHRMH